MALDNLRGGTKRVVEEESPLNNLRGGTKRVVIVDGGGGKSVPQYATMPTADASNVDNIVQYKGETDATYTNGYFYKNVGTTTASSATATQTVGATLSNIAVDVDTLESFTGWTADNSLQIFYTADGWSVDTTSLGVTYTGTPNVGDAITITYTAESTSYAWTQIDVQPAPEALPDQTGQSGKFLTTDGTDASWSDKPLVNTATGTGGLSILGSPNSRTGGMNIGSNSSTWGNYSVVIGPSAFGAANTTGSVAIGQNCAAQSQYVVSIGNYTSASGNYSIGIGYRASTGAVGAIQFNASSNTSIVNTDANTFKVANANGNFEIMSADGTVPTDRFTTTPSADGTYVPTLTISSGVATRTWGSGGGGGGSLPTQTGNAGKFLTTDGTDASWSDKPLVNGATGNNSISVGATSTTINSIGVGKSINLANYGVAVGHDVWLNGDYSVAIGADASSDAYGIAIGPYTSAAAAHAIQLGVAQYGSNVNNFDANTFKVANANGNFELMNANGNLPADRLASTTGLADGNYRLRLVMASGVPTLEWVAE